MCSLCAWKARQPSQSHADARGAREGRCKDGKPSLRFVCLTFGRGEERRAGEDERSQRAHSDAKSEAEARAPVRHSIQCPWTPCRQAAAAAASIQFHHRLPADAILIPAAVLHPHTSLSYSEIPQLFATACILSLPLSSLLPLIRSLHQSLHNTLSLSSLIVLQDQDC